MLKQQLSVFLKNNQGTLADLISLLGREGIVMHAVTLADTARYGVLRAIVSDSEKALEILQQHQYSACLTEVLCVLVPEGTDGAGKVLEELSGSGTDIEYLYLLRTEKGTALILGVPDPAKSAGMLAEKGFTALNGAQE